jgi:hypothetical protein
MDMETFDAMSEKRSGQRWLTCLKGQVQTSVGNSVECYIRDFSSEGARLEVSAGAVLPENIHLYFPLKEATFRARVRWRNANEIGVAFDVPETAPPSDPVQAQLLQRVQRLETENAELRLEANQLRVQLERITTGEVVRL